MARDSSWSKSNVPNLIGRKQVDWSLFEWGTTIPIGFHESFKTVGKPDPNLNRDSVVLTLEKDKFNAHIQRSSISSRKNITYQLRYDSNAALRDKLLSTFQASYNYIVEERARQIKSGKKRPHIVVPTHLAEFIDFKLGQNQYEVEMVFSPSSKQLSTRALVIGTHRSGKSYITSSLFPREKFPMIEDEDLDFQRDVFKSSTDDRPIEDKPKTKKSKSDMTLKAGYPRDPHISKKAINASQFCCEIDPNHQDFLSRSTGENYVEAHHLVPIGAYNDFDVSLDVEANIVALCNTCHRKMHYAYIEEVLPLVQKLFTIRKERLEKCGIKVDFERLCRYYQ